MGGPITLSNGGLFWHVGDAYLESQMMNMIQTAHPPFHRTYTKSSSETGGIHKFHILFSLL